MRGTRKSGRRNLRGKPGGHLVFGTARRIRLRLELVEAAEKYLVLNTSSITNDFVAYCLLTGFKLRRKLLIIVWIYLDSSRYFLLNPKPSGKILQGYFRQSCLTLEPGAFNLFQSTTTLYSEWSSMSLLGVVLSLAREFMKLHQWAMRLVTKTGRYLDVDRVKAISSEFWSAVVR
ncbi:hypothetical protein B0H19DRAFT_1065688 [Mycena capillaripes]|nr:hypothetical protein B0H19DRAFT_1065688 [Mycena capillaripes]